MIAYCVFNIGDRRVGIPMTSVREILDKEFIAPTPIPLAPEFVHGLFNLRGQVLPFLDLSGFVGATAMNGPTSSDRAVIVERGDFRFATLGQRIDTVEVGEETLQPLAGAALHPALDSEAQTERGSFQVIHLDRLEACLKQSLKFTEASAPSRAASTTSTPNETPTN
jgi:purine-binding chemotaxis protein CheW